MRDEGLLDSELARAINTHLAKNHAFLSIGVFLSMNGHKLVADQVDALQTMLAVAAGELGEKGLAAWIQKNSVAK